MTYGAKTAVDAIDFTARPGLVTGFLGSNGAGKSTTMRMIVGLDRPTGGTVTVNGKPYAQHRAPRHQVGALLDATTVHAGRSARNHLLSIAATHRIGTRRVDEVIGIPGLESVARKRVGGFSLGMGQRLGLAVALLGDPATLILDEPVDGLDRGTSLRRHRCLPSRSRKTDCSPCTSDAATLRQCPVTNMCAIGTDRPRAYADNVTRIFGTEFAAVYPLYVAKVERKGRTTTELDQVIMWLTGFDDTTLRRHAQGGTTFEEFFAEAPMNPSASLITGVVCGIRVEAIEDPLMQKIRYLDKLVDELARGKPLEKVLRAAATASKT